MQNHSAIVLMGALALSAMPLSGQDALSPINRVPGLGSFGLGSGTDLSEEDPFAPPSDGDSDLGEQSILRRAPERTPVRLRFLSDAWWSDNLAATNTHKSEGWFWANYLEASWRPRLGDHIFLDSFAEQGIFKYEGGTLDFESTQLGLGVIKIFPEWGDLAVFSRYEYLYTNANNPAYPLLITADKHLKDHFHRLRFGAQKTLFVRPLGSAYVATDALLSIDADPSSLERNEYSFQFGYLRKLTHRFSTSLYYRGSWLDYRNSSRQDWNHIVGLEFNYILNDWARLHTSLLYSNNDSNTVGDFDSYESFQAGLGIGLNAKF